MKITKKDIKSLLKIIKKDVRLAFSIAIVPIVLIFVNYVMDFSKQKSRENNIKKEMNILKSYQNEVDFVKNYYFKHNCTRDTIDSKSYSHSALYECKYDDKTYFSIIFVDNEVILYRNDKRN